ncbi:BTAD domain-containing putative transcriptional regulator [Actinomadura sp. NPDC023710]|uniref:BTAD domain-containing putative transcriptional regulator n=1 Tax=Actinomadura sp. NPDC023710 TaxID=3158219 RepID=UPI0033E21CA5
MATLLRPDTGNWLFLAVIRLVGWGAWALFAGAFCSETVSYLAGRSAPTLPRPVRPLQVLARDLVATATLVFGTATIVTVPASATAHATTDTPSADEPSASPPHSTEWEPLLGDDTPPPSEPSEPEPRTRVVHRGDTLWNLARRAYGSGDRYPKIFKASRTIDQPPGIPALTDPNELHPGQRIRIPSVRKRADTPPPKRGPHADHPGQPSEPKANHDYGPPPHVSQELNGAGSRPSRVPSPVVAPPADNPPARPSPTTPRATNQDRPGIALPSGSYIGLGLAAALSLAIAATRLHRRRQLHVNTGDVPTHQPSEPPEPVAKARKAHLDIAYADNDSVVPSDSDLVAQDHFTPPPDHITLGTRDRAPINLPLAGLMLGLTGDGALAAARAVTTELLAKARRNRAELLIPQPDADALFPDAALTDIPGLTITPSLAAATSQLEAEILRRARALEATDQPDLNALRATDQTDPLPALLLTASVAEPTAATVHAITQLGARYGIGTLILGPAPAGTTLHLNDDTTVTQAEGPYADALTGARLFHLTVDDASAMLHTLRTAAGIADSKPVNIPEPRPGSDLSPEVTSRTPAPSAIHVPAPTDQAQPRLIRLQVLGPVRLHTADGPITTGVRRSARDLLAYLALQPGGISRDQAINALWPDHQPETATTQFNTAVANIRKTLRTATGLREPMYVTHIAGRYRLDPDLIDVDEQRLSATLAKARQATTDPERIAALTPVSDLYTAEFATDLTHDWAENHREHLRRAVIDALARLARLLQHDHPEQALNTLEQAITHDPYAEPLYRSVMQLQAELGQPDAVHRTYRLLAARLADLDTEPDDETHQLLTNLQRHP